MVTVKIGFYTSLISYIVFLLAELVKPGFVTNYMSVHWFLLTTILFAVWWGSLVKAKRSNKHVSFAVSIFLGLVLAVLVWQYGTDLAEFRILSSILALFLPPIVLGVLRSNK
jgi:hypothetical protein